MVPFVRLMFSMKCLAFSLRSAPSMCCAFWFAATGAPVPEMPVVRLYRRSPRPCRWGGLVEYTSSDAASVAGPFPAPFWSSGDNRTSRAAEGQVGRE